MKSGLTRIGIIDRNKRFVDSLAKLATTRVMVGVPAEKGARNDGEPINNAGLAYVHTFGAPEAGIPPRPFLQPGLQEKKKEIVAALEKVGKVALDTGDAARIDHAARIDRGFDRVGLIAATAVQTKIRNGPFVPLKPASIRARQTKSKSRSNTDIHPLINTGALLASITYVIRKANFK